MTQVTQRGCPLELLTFGVALVLGYLCGSIPFGLIPQAPRGHAGHPIGLGRQPEDKLFALLTALLWVMHGGNIARLLAGTEGKISKHCWPHSR
jgi:glycerol-3-phosphate acyltransferase PlsY